MGESFDRSSKYVWILYNGDHNLGRVGYYVTVERYNEEQATQLAQVQQTRLVYPIIESEEKV